MTGNYKVKNEYQPTAALPNIRSNAPFVIQPSSERNSFGRNVATVENAVANRLLAALPSGDFERLLPLMQLVFIKTGEVVYQPEGNCDYIYFPETAVFSQMSILENGKTIETAMIGSEGMLGISSVLDFHPTNFWTQALAGGSAFKMSRQIFRQETMLGGRLQTVFLKYVNAYIKQLSQRAVCNNHHCIENRFSTWLLMLADRSNRVKLALTQEQIATALGVQRPSVTGIAQNLRNRGIIEYLRGHIVVNRRKLKAAACECYSAIG